jgi:site-specific DNA-methyltransferase (adenine-specific)
VVIDPCAGSGTTLRACMELNRNSYGFEISKEFCRKAKEEMLTLPTDNQIKIDDWLGKAQDEPIHRREQL